MVTEGDELTVTVTVADCGLDVVPPVVRPASAPLPPPPPVPPPPVDLHPAVAVTVAVLLVVSVVCAVAAIVGSHDRRRERADRRGKGDRDAAEQVAVRIRDRRGDHRRAAVRRHGSWICPDDDPADRSGADVDLDGAVCARRGAARKRRDGCRHRRLPPAMNRTMAWP